VGSPRRRVREVPAAEGLITVVTANAPLTLVARQPIVDAAGRVQGHELLFRGAPDAVSGGGERATATVLVSTFLDAKLDDIVGGKRAWVNVSRDFLLRVDPLPMPPERVILELLEDQEVDEALLDRLAQLRREAYDIALDDFTWRAELDPLVDVATHVKLDMRGLDPDAFADHARLLAARGLDHPRAPGARAPGVAGGVRWNVLGRDG
jgi:c-di-GMP phosphodiesterase